MRHLSLFALALVACASDPAGPVGQADAGAEAGDGAPASLEGAYGGSMIVRATELAPVNEPTPNGSISGPTVGATVVNGTLAFGPFFPRCVVRLLPQSPTLALVDAATCEGDPRDAWRGRYVTARLVLRPGASLTVGDGRISGALAWDFVGTVDRQQPNEGMTQRGVVTLTLNLVRAP